jgi:glutaredoxin
MNTAPEKPGCFPDGFLQYLYARSDGRPPAKPRRGRFNVPEEKRVKMYTLSTCGHCKATKKFFDDNGLKYEFTDVDLLEGEERKSVIEEVKRINPRCSYPTIIIGDEIVVGFKEWEIRKVLGLV